jgi:hypothetical protein
MSNYPDFRADIKEVMKSLQISSDDFSLVNLYKYKKILVLILDKFTTVGKKGLSYSQWWDFLRKPTEAIQLDYAHIVIEELVSPDEKIWFIAEDWKRNKQQGNFWLYEGKIKSIVSILGEMYGFEYYLVSKKLEWLLCENHHNILIGTGQPMIEKIQLLRKKLETVKW